MCRHNPHVTIIFVATVSLGSLVLQFAYWPLCKVPAPAPTQKVVEGDEPLYQRQVPSGPYVARAQPHVGIDTTVQ